MGLDLKRGSKRTCVLDSVEHTHPGVRRSPRMKKPLGSEPPSGQDESARREEPPKEEGLATLLSSLFLGCFFLGGFLFSCLLFGRFFLRRFLFGRLLLGRFLLSYLFGRLFSCLLLGCLFLDSLLLRCFLLGHVIPPRNWNTMVSHCDLKGTMPIKSPATAHHTLVSVKQS